MSSGTRAAGASNPLIEAGLAWKCPVTENLSNLAGALLVGGGGQVGFSIAIIKVSAHDPARHGARLDSGCADRLCNFATAWASRPIGLPIRKFQIRWFSPQQSGDLPPFGRSFSSYRSLYQESSMEVHQSRLAWGSPLSVLPWI